MRIPAPNRPLAGAARVTVLGSESGSQAVARTAARHTSWVTTSCRQKRRPSAEIPALRVIRLSRTWLTAMTSGAKTQPSHGREMSYRDDSRRINVASGSCRLSGSPPAMCASRVVVQVRP